MERLYKRKIRRYPLCLTRRCRGALSLRARERGSLSLTPAMANKKAVSRLEIPLFCFTWRMLFPIQELSISYPRTICDPLRICPDTLSLLFRPASR